MLGKQSARVGESKGRRGREGVGEGVNVGVVAAVKDEVAEVVEVIAVVIAGGAVVPAVLYSLTSLNRPR